MKRAAIIAIYRLLRESPPYWHTDSDSPISLFDGTAEQLLADLRVLSNPWAFRSIEVEDAAARVRALLPEEGHEPAPHGGVEDIVQAIAGERREP